MVNSELVARTIECVGAQVFTARRRHCQLNPFDNAAMTSGAFLSVITKEADSNVPALGYAGSYAFANVLLTVAGSVILLT